MGLPDILRSIAELVSPVETDPQLLRGALGGLAAGYTLLQFIQFQASLIGLGGEAHEKGGGGIGAVQLASHLRDALPRDMELSRYLGKCGTGVLEEMGAQTPAKYFRGQVDPSLADRDWVRVGGKSAH